MTTKYDIKTDLDRIEALDMAELSREIANLEDTVFRIHGQLQLPPDTYETEEALDGWEYRARQSLAVKRALLNFARRRYRLFQKEGDQ